MCVTLVDLTPFHGIVFLWLINQLNVAGEIVYLLADAEGATAPETLRHPDRSGMGLWKESTDTLRWKFRCSTEDVSLR